MDSDSDDGLPTASHIVIVDAMMSTGLRLAGYTQERIQRATYAKNADRFKKNFGVLPLTACTIYKDMLLT